MSGDEVRSKTAIDNAGPQRIQMKVTEKPGHRIGLPPRAIAAGALAFGALAVGIIALGALAIGRLTIRRAYIGRLEVDELIIRRTRMKDAQNQPQH